jgi:spoIIIJ-associated protein
VNDIPQTQAYTDKPSGSAEIISAADTPGEALGYLQKILSLAGFEAAARVGRVTDEEVTLDIDGPDSSLLIGRHGQTLDALQYLLLVVMSAGRPAPPSLRVTIDVEGYRVRRAETLTRYAESLAAQVHETNEEAVLEPLNPLERRIVHTALVDNPYVETYSEGFGPERHIVIAPRKTTLTDSTTIPDENE